MCDSKWCDKMIQWTRERLAGMHDMEGTELQPGDIVEFDGDLAEVIKESGQWGPGVIWARFLTSSVTGEKANLFEHQIRLVERKPRPELYERRGQR